MRMILALGLGLAISESAIQGMLESAFYPALLLIFIVASLGVPIPEDIPLILAGVILKTHPHIASPIPAFLVSMVGIMSGDIILYSLGRRWGRDVFAHRSVAWLITPRRLEMMTERFHMYGVWACFFGRFMVGVRAMMCLTAGVTRFPFHKFFLADFCGALLSVPFFIALGYIFANMLDQLKAYVAGAQTIIAVVVGLVIAIVVWYEVRRFRRMRAQHKAERAAEAAHTAVEPEPKTLSKSNANSGPAGSPSASVPTAKEPPFTAKRALRADAEV